MDNEYSIEVNNIKKSFKIYYDKGHTLKETSLFKKRRNYEMREVLKGISFKVKKGEAVALIGHNGCGKSTTLKMLTRIMYPDEGTITMRGRVSSLIELGAGFHPDMTGRENIFNNAAIFGLTHKEIEERVEQIIEFSELEEFIDNPVRTYSSGMYMRLAFAVAINVDADILLIDEILAVGDAAFQSKCFKKLREIKANGTTIVIVSHDGDSMKKFCDRCIWIDEGLIADEGKSLDVIDNYLFHVNQKEIEKEKLRNKNKISSNSTKKEENDSEKSEDDSAGPADKYTDSKMHFGNKKVVIDKVEIINSEGEVTKILNSNEKYSLKYYYSVNEKIDEIIVGMGIFTLDGVWIFGTNSLLTNHTIKCNENGGVIVFECEPTNLLSGTYRLQVSVIDMNSDPLDYHQDYTHFDIVNTSREAGIIHYDTDWIVAE